MNYDSKINNYNASEVNEIGVNTMKVETIQTGWTLVSSSVPDRSKHRYISRIAYAIRKSSSPNSIK